MANPYFSAYKTQRYSFIGSPQQRDGTYLKDQRFLNMYPELIKSSITDGKKYYLKKRPGTAQWQSFPSGTSQGVFFWNNAYFTATSGTLYMNTTAILGLTTTTGPVGFAEFRTDALGDILFVCDGTKGWLISMAGVPTLITDANFPSPHIPAPVFLDGYIFLIQTGSQIIRNSDILAGPSTWPADGFIDAEMFPDPLVWLTKSLNYLVCVGSESVEFLYDNANATGSPLQRNAPAVSQFGSPAPYTVCQTEKLVIMVGSSGTGGRSIWTITGFQPTDIASEPVREALDLEGSNIGQASAFIVRVSGHEFYILNLLGSNRTFVYDFDEQMWHEWSGGSTQAIFPYRFSTDGVNGVPVLQGYLGGPTVYLSPSLYVDNGGAVIFCQVITSKVDFDTIMRKRIFRLSLICDSPDGVINSPITVDWSDDDYNTWVGARALQINGNYPTTTQLGITRRRAFRFTYTDVFSLRMESFELDIVSEQRR